MFKSLCRTCKETWEKHSSKFCYYLPEDNLEYLELKYQRDQIEKYHKDFLDRILGVKNEEN